MIAGDWKSLNCLLSPVCVLTKCCFIPPFEAVSKVEFMRSFYTVLQRTWPFYKCHGTSHLEGWDGEVVKSCSVQGLFAYQTEAGSQGRPQVCGLERVTLRLGAHIPGLLDLQFVRPGHIFRASFPQSRDSVGSQAGRGSWLTKHNLIWASLLAPPVSRQPQTPLLYISARTRPASWDNILISNSLRQKRNFKTKPRILEVVLAQGLARCRGLEMSAGPGCPFPSSELCFPTCIGSFLGHTLSSWGQAGCSSSRLIASDIYI